MSRSETFSTNHPSQEFSLKGVNAVALPSVKELRAAFEGKYLNATEASQIMPPNVAIETFAQMVGQVALAQDILNRGEHAGLPREVPPAAALGRAAAMLQSLGFEQAAEMVMNEVNNLRARIGRAGFGNVERV